MSSRHVMLDLECLGNTPPGIILSIGAVVFDADGYHNQLYRRIDVASSLLHGLKADEDTIKWWNNQMHEPKYAAFYEPGSVVLEEALTNFSHFVDKKTYLWAKGPDYDCVMLAAAYKAVGMKLPWSFRFHRDVRTILALSGVHQQLTGNKHNALDDAVNQAEAVARAHAKLGVQFE